MKAGDLKSTDPVVRAKAEREWGELLTEWRRAMRDVRAVIEYGDDGDEVAAVEMLGVYLGRRWVLDHVVGRLPLDLVVGAAKELSRVPDAPGAPSSS